MSDDLLKGAGTPPEGTGNDAGTPPEGTGNGAGTPPEDSGAAGFDMNQFMSEGWKDCIPEDLKDRAEWGRINNVQDVFKNYISAQQTISKSVRIPDATSSAEDITAFYTKLGKPVTASEYDFEYTKREGQVFDKNSFDFSVFQDIADKANLTKDQYQALASAYIDVQNDMVSRYNTSVAEQAGIELREAEATLRKEWGKDYGSNINNISAKINQMYPEETVKRMEAVGLFRDANFLKSQLALTKMMTGDTIYIEGQGIEDVPQTIENLRAKRDALMEADYAKNKTQVNELNKQIVQLQIAQQSQIGRRIG